MRSDLVPNQQAASQRSGGQLPAETTGFVGRETELARVIALVETSRLVTVTGTGGVGKTRVALRAAEQAMSRFPDGVRLVELSTVNAAGLPGAIAQTLPKAAAQTLDAAEFTLDALVGCLHDRSMLLVLDTCEHLVDACATLADAILREAPGVTLLATSRQPLDVPGEATYQIQPMRLPAPGADGVYEADSVGSAGSEAVELFAQRAAAALPGFTVTAENQADVIRLCQRLDGIPLAIELAAVRLRALPLRQLASRIEGGYSLVTGGRRGALGRHQTLEGAISWSYELCTRPEQMLWARLSVFAGPFELETAEDACAGGDLPHDQVAEAIVRLVDKSVLLREPALPWEEGEVARYRLLDTLREFGGRRLDTEGTAGLVRSQFVSRYLRTARTFADHFLDDRQLNRYRKLRAEHANITAALEYSLAARHGSRRLRQEGAELAIALAGYWQISGLPGQGREWLAKAARLCPGDTREHARALIARAQLGAFHGQAAEAVADATAGIEIAMRIHDLPTAARGYLYLNLALTFAGLTEAAEAGTEAKLRLESLGDRVGLLVLDMHMALLANTSGDTAAAIVHAEQGLLRLGDSGELWLHGCLYASIALARLDEPGKEADCRASLDMALRAAHELGDVLGIAFVLEACAWLAARAGRAERTAWLLGAAASQWQASLWQAGQHKGQPPGSQHAGTAHLAGAAAGEELHRRAAEATLEALGRDRYDTLVRRGGQHPLEQVVACALSDSEELPGTAPRASPVNMLTNRERQIADLVASGLSNREIAERMVISKRTVDAHVEHIFAKLGMKSRVQLTVWLRDQSL